jgi:aryl-alcohol dehydrogenase-like predicted oxidoreductase
MNYRRLGKTGLEVSEICLGTADFGAHTDDAGAQALLDTFVEGGGNLVDTADMYSNWHPGNKGGEAETMLGRWMKSKGNRRSMVVATKVRVPMWPGPNGEGLGRKHIRWACEDSLRRLQTDHIDLYQTHYMDEATPIEETLRALDDLIRQGKVLYAGCSNMTGRGLEEACAAARAMGIQGYVSLEPRYNLLDRAWFEADLLPRVRKYGLGVMPYSSLAEGFLTGIYRRKGSLPENSRAKGVKKSLFSDRNFKVVERLASMGRARKKTPAQMALAWLLAHPWMSAPIVGPSTPAELKEDMGASGIALSAKEKQELDRLSA